MEENSNIFHFVNLGPSETPRLDTLYPGKKWVAYGVDNLLPNQLLELSRISPVHNNIIVAKSELITGNNITITNPEAAKWAETLDYNNGFKKIFYKSALDYITYGGFSLQILWKKYQNQIADVIFQDWSKVRIGFDEEKNEEGLYNQGVWISDRWDRAIYKFKPCFYPYYKTGENCDKPSFLYFKRYTQGNDWYPLPDWFAAYNSIITETELIQFKKYNTLNSFTASGVLKLPGNVKPEMIEQFKKEIHEQMTGTHNAGKILVVTADGEKAVEWMPLNVSPEKSVTAYINEAREDIIISHRLPSLTLIGLRGGASLGGDGGTIEIANEIFFENVIYPIREMIKDEYLKIFKDAGFETDIVIEDKKIIITS